MRLPGTSVAVAVSVLAIAARADAQRLQVARTPVPPVIDGEIGLQEWAASAHISRLHQVEPVEFAPPTERTVWYLSYDEKALYVAARAYDSKPGDIVAQQLRQGASIGSDDSLHLLLDPFNNKRSGYTFALNPNGVRFDGIYTSGTRLLSEWDGIWRGAASYTDDGWSIEMAIPFNTLTFDPANDIWGVNVWREIPRKDEVIAWSSRNGETDPTVSAEMAGMRGLTQARGLELAPSLSSISIEDRESDTSSTELNPALDVGYKLGSATNVLLTFNTDFAATEVDDRELGLRRFGLFFPEKRSFFLADFDIFQFGGVPAGSDGDSGQIGQFSESNGLAFFSRRIGLSDEREPVDIRYGAKVSGRLAGVDFGSLYIRQDGFDGRDDSDLLVARMTRGVLAESTLGAIATFGDPSSDRDNTLVGTDFLYRNTRLGFNRSMVGQFWIQRSNNAGISGDDLAYSAVLSLPAQNGFEIGAQYQVVEDSFLPPLGFANRVGVRLTGVALGYSRVLDPRRRIRELEHAFAFERWEFLDTGRVQSEDLEFELLTLRSATGDRLRMSVSRRREGLLPGEQPLEDIGIVLAPAEYTFNRYSIGVRSASHRRFAARLDIGDGGYYGGDRLSIDPELDWTPNPHVNFALRYSFSRFDFAGASATTRELTFRNTLAFNSQISLITLAQYDDVSDDIGLNLRFRYNQSAGRDIWIVLNHNWLDDPVEERFRSTASSAAAKIRFTFRY